MKELIIVQTFDKDGFLTGYEIKGEIVRCKDCTWSEHMSGFLLCGAWDARAVDDNDFCSYGERRSE